MRLAKDEHSKHVGRTSSEINRYIDGIVPDDAEHHQNRHARSRSQHRDSRSQHRPSPSALPTTEDDGR